MKEPQSSKEQAGKSLESSFKQPYNSWWKVLHRGMLLPFALLTGILRPSDPTNSEMKIILRISLFCGMLAILFYSLQEKTLADRLEDREVELIDRQGTLLLLEDESSYYLFNENNGRSAHMFKSSVQYCEGMEKLEPTTWCTDWKEVVVE